MTTPKQLPLLLEGATPVTGPQTPLADERQRAIDASERYLETIETRAHEMPGISNGDRKDALNDVQRRRARLRQTR